MLLESGARFRADKWYGLYAATGAGQQGHTEILAMLLDNADPGPAQLDYLFGPALIIAMLQARDARNFETMGNKIKRLGWGALFMLGGH